MSQILRLLRFAVLLTAALFSSAAAQESLPRFERAECFTGVQVWASPLDAECGWLVVPQLRVRPEAGSVRLPVVRVRAKEPNGSPPLVYLHGGPGGAGGIRTNGQAILQWPIARHRDVIVYDHRGAGMSEPELCPEVAEEINRARETERGDDQARWNRNARDCVASMRAHGIDPIAYTTQSNVLDLVDLRRVLGYDRWDLYGVSYGGTLAQEAMRQDGGAIRAVVLAYASTTGPAMQAEAPLSYQRSLEHLFDSCARQPSCRDAFPTLADDFFALYRELNDRPVDVRVERTSGPTTIRMDGQRFLGAMRCQLASPRTLTRIPLLVREMGSPAPQAAQQVLAGSCGVGSGFNATIELVICHAIHGDAYRDAAAEVRRQLRPELKLMSAGDNPECAQWQQSFADPATHEFVKSDIPTLLITGEFDERAPTSLSRRIASQLSRAWLYEIPGASHGGAVTGCHAEILFQFLGDPSKQPDASCLAEMTPVVFETQQLLLPTLSLRIGATGASAGWSGLWHAEVPNAPLPVTFELTLEGPAVRGTLHPQELAVFDGSVQGEQIVFRIRSPDNLRTITFTGVLQGDEITFTRDVQVPDGAPPGGRWIFGVDGVRSFVARRAG